MGRFTPEAAFHPDKMISVPGGAAPDDTWDRALMAGLMLEVLLGGPPLNGGSESQRLQLKTWVKSTLAAQLAGRLPLASFNRLARGLDRWFEVLYPILAGCGEGAWREAVVDSPESSPEGVVRKDMLHRFLVENPGLLPRRRHRKLDQEKLCAFLEATGGAWFRLRDFEAFFRVDRKTAWEYVQKLLHAGLLLHNQGHSTAVRYRLAPAFVHNSTKVPGEEAAYPFPVSSGS